MTTWASVGGTIRSNDTPKSAAKISFRIKHSSVRLMHHPALRLLASGCDKLHPSGGWKRSRRSPNPQSKQASPRKTASRQKRATLTYTEKRSEANLRILDFGPESTSTEMDANPATTEQQALFLRSSAP